MFSIFSNWSDDQHISQAEHGPHKHSYILDKVFGPWLEVRCLENGTDVS